MRNHHKFLSKSASLGRDTSPVAALCKSPAKNVLPFTPKCAHGTDTQPFGLCHCLPPCLAWCERHGETSAPRSSRCSSVSVTLGTPGRSACLTNARRETNKCIWLIKALWIFYAGACAGTETETGKKKQQLGCLSCALIGLLPSLQQTHRKSSILYVCRASLSEARGVIFSFSAINI